MKRELMVFENGEFGNVRVINQNGEPWFIVTDLCKVLEISNPSMAIKSVDEDDLNIIEVIDDIGRNQKANSVNESGMYQLILKSRKPSAKKFKKWVTSEVLPTIRKHGAYMTEEVIEKTLTDPDFLIQLATQLKEEKQKRLSAEQQIEEQKPLVTFAETCLKSSDNILMRELAKIVKDEGLNIGQNRLYDKLREWKLIMKGSTEPYQYSMERGWFAIEEKSVNTPYGVKLTKTTKVTPKGQIYIIERLKKEL